MNIKFPALYFLAFFPSLVAGGERHVKGGNPEKPLPSHACQDEMAFPDTENISDALKNAPYGQRIPRGKNNFPKAFESDRRIESLFSQAFKDRTFRLEELSLPDGRRMTKVHSGSSTYCVYKESLGLTKGRDQLARGVRTMTTSCP